MRGQPSHIGTLKITTRSLTPMAEKSLTAALAKIGWWRFSEYQLRLGHVEIGLGCEGGAVQLRSLSDQHGTRVISSLVPSAVDWRLMYSSSAVR